jgi:tRNA A-37 threonylcarbamoyl transferase component Bud32
MNNSSTEKFGSLDLDVPWVDPAIARFIRTLARAAGVMAGSVALLTLAGWIFALPDLKHPFNASSLQVAAAIDFILWSVAFLLLSAKASPKLILIGRILAVLIGIAAALNLAEHVFVGDLGLAIPVWEAKDGDVLTFPGHIAPDVAIGLMLLSAATFLYSLRPWRKRISIYKLLSLIVIVPNLIILGCCAAGLPHVCLFFGCTRVSAITSTVMLLACFTVLFIKPTDGFTQAVTYRTPGGRLLRSIFCGLAALIPLVAIVQAGAANVLYDQAVAYGIMVVMLIAMFAACTAWGAKKMDTIDAEKAQAVQLLQDSISASAQAPQRTYKMICLQCAKEYNAETERCPDDGSELSKITDKLKEGSIFAEKYEILRFLGSGGICTIYLARHMHMNKNVALKLLKAHYAAETKQVQRFQRESQATCKLSHANIVAVHDFGISQDGQPYIIMDYLDGVSLSGGIDSFGAIPWQKAVSIFMQICEGLQYAHANGVLHRDLKPANIMLVEENGKQSVAKIVDFGLAKTVDTGADLTNTGELLGSPTYMSPEQCRGEAADVRSEIYSMGALMYECLAGHPAINSSNVYETIMLQISGPEPVLPVEIDIPLWLESCVLKALAKEPERRQQSAAELLKELHAGFVSPIGI